MENNIVKASFDKLIRLYDDQDKQPEDKFEIDEFFL